MRSWRRDGGTWIRGRQRINRSVPSPKRKGLCIAVSKKAEGKELEPSPSFFLSISLLYFCCEKRDSTRGKESLRIEATLVCFQWKKEIEMLLSIKSSHPVDSFPVHRLDVLEFHAAHPSGYHSNHWLSIRISPLRFERSSTHAPFRWRS